MAVFEVHESQYVVKIEATPFLVALGLILARNLDITRKMWAVQARRRVYRVSRLILDKDRAFLEPSKFSKMQLLFFFFARWVTIGTPRLRHTGPLPYISHLNSYGNI